jgi:hypothetical protein
MSADTAHDPLSRVASWLSQEAPTPDADPLPAMFAERERICGLLRDTPDVGDHELLKQAGAIEDQISETVASSFEGLFGQLELLHMHYGCELLDSIIAGIKALSPGASEKPATMEEMATVEFEAMPEIFEHFKSRALNEEFRALGVDLRVAAACMARSMVELIEGLKVLGEDALDELLDHLQEAGETFRSFAELVEAARMRQVIAAAAALGSAEERKGGSP